MEEPTNVAMSMSEEKEKEIEEGLEEENNFEKTIEIGDSFKKVFKIFNGYGIEDVAVNIYEDRLEISEMSPSHTVLVEAIFEKEENKEIDADYEEKEPLRVGIDVEKFYKSLQSFGSFSDIELTLSNDRIVLEEDHTVRLPTIEPAEEELPEPDLDLTVKSRKIKFTTALNKMKKIFGKQDPKLRMTSGKVFLEYGDNDTLENFSRKLGELEKNDSETTEFTNIYAYEYLDVPSKKWVFETGKDLPLVLKKTYSSYNESWSVDAKIMIAPRISTEQE